MIQNRPFLGGQRLLKSAAAHVRSAVSAAGLQKRAGGVGGGQPITTPGQAAIVAIGVLYIFLLVLLPFLNVFVEAFSNGPSAFLESLVDPDFQAAVQMTLTLAALTVPINTVFGVAAALVVSLGWL